MEPVRDIVVPVDLAEPRDDAIRYAIDLSGRLGSRVHLVHVYQAPSFALPEGASLADAAYAARQAEAVEHAMAHLLARHRTQGARLSAHVVHGLPHAQIVWFAERVRASLIVMGTHARRGLDRVLLGSVAEKVLRRATVPVLVVPPGTARRVA